MDNQIAAYHILVKKQTPFEMDSRILEKNKYKNKQTNLSKGAFPYMAVICECVSVSTPNFGIKVVGSKDPSK
jgi:hypothetical protein